MNTQESTLRLDSQDPKIGLGLDDPRIAKAFDDTKKCIAGESERRNKAVAAVCPQMQ